MKSLPECRWRDVTDPDGYVCRSAKFVHPPNLVSADFCAECGYVDHAPPRTPLRGLPCVHLGMPAEVTGKPNGRTKSRRLPIFGCAVHGRCTVAHEGEVGRVTSVRSCGDCPDYLSRNPLAPDSAEMRRRADAALTAIPAYPKGRYRGRGIVIAGGGDRYFASLYVSIRALRHVGCRLPIQVWYLGRHDEMPAQRQALLKPYAVECIDADDVRRRHPARRLDGWELKVFATLHSPFEEVLFLDADCYPCRRPDFLFRLKDYRACGAIFWPDMAVTDPRLKWAAFGVPDPRRPGSVESGQYVVHKRICWRPLQLAWFYNDHSDYYYRYCYGDKHTFEVAWTRCQQPFVMWQAQARWEDVAYLHPGPDGRPLFVHRCADKFRLDRYDYVTPQNYQEPVYQRHLPLEGRCWEWMSELARRIGHRS